MPRFLWKVIDGKKDSARLIIMFDNIIGQDGVKRKLGFYIDCFKSSGVSPHLFFVAPKGCGKTMMAVQYGKEMEDIKPEKKVRLVNCSSIKGMKGFFDSIIIPHVADKDVTFIFDEASELPKDVTMALLTILNPNPANATSFSYLDYNVDFDFKRQTFIFCTSESHKIFHALADRLTRVDLESYSVEELGTVLRKVVPDISFEDKLIDAIAHTLRGNPRQATKMGNNIKNFVGDAKDFSPRNWDTLRKSLNIMPYGVNENELVLLRILRERMKVTLTGIAAITGMTRSAIQRDVETYLLKTNMISIEVGGRTLTKRGHDFMALVDGEQKLPTPV